MSAPAGWYPQPDGRQRYWDGAQWTEHFHDGPAEAAETAETASESARQEVHVQSSYGQPYGTGASGGPATPAGSATPAYGPPPSATSSSSGLGKGCLIAAIVGLVVVALVVVAGILLIRKAADDVKTGLDRVATAQPTPGGSDGVGSSAPLEGVTADIGKAFTVGDISVADGWTLTKQDVLDFWMIKAVATAPLAEDTILDVSARNGSTELDTTMCTGSKGATELNCLPFTEDLSSATSIVVAPAF